ncbi:hypothetical protein DFP72DRAFT_959700 [Ephemerocybe angulata]|uniref:Uncharacterized protein n=1 Tax=Ephemerocybe angulata TaxID=980116 RepID=A0A8H6MDV6_9AGAR|nr:hypothetical protein DFP72DRAFT_959700 [Tulosesus angulatus]
MLSDSTSTNSRLSEPISPTFSTDTAPRSEATSDEQPDLGAFTTILRAWNHLQPPRRIPIPQFHSSPPSQTSQKAQSSTSSQSRTFGSEAGTDNPVTEAAETLWAQRQLQSYLNSTTLHSKSQRAWNPEDDEHEPSSVDNDLLDARHGHSSPTYSPYSYPEDDPRTVKTLEAKSNLDELERSSLAQLPRRGVMAVPPHSFRSSSNQILPTQPVPKRPEFLSRNHPTAHSDSTLRSSGTENGLSQSFKWPALTHGIPQKVSNDTFPSTHAEDDPESAVLSLLSQARARSLINDNDDSTTAHSTSKGSPTTRSHTSPYYGHSAALHKQARSFSPQVEPPSPLPTPEELEGRARADESHTPKGNHIWSYDHQQRISEPERYLHQAVAHPYPHPLKGHHGLPATIEPDLQDDSEPLKENEEDGHLSDDSEWEWDPAQPSLGLLDEALGFIAAERAKWEATRAGGAHREDGTATPPEWDYTPDAPPPAKRKRRRKKTAVTATTTKPQDGIVAPPMEASLSATRPLLLAANEAHAPLDSTQGKEEKRITILTRPKPTTTDVARGDMNELDEGEPPLVLLGKKGNRVGRKERERIKVKHDREREALQQALGPRTHTRVQSDDWDADDDEIDYEDEEGEDDEVEGMRAGSRAYIHQEFGKGAYKSTPATPGTVTPTRIDFKLGTKVPDGIGMAKGSEQEDEEGEPNILSTPSKRSRKKPRKRSKTISHARSFPNLRRAAANGSLDLDEEYLSSEAVPVFDQSKRSRLIGLAYKLQLLFPEQQKDLTRIIQRLESAGRKHVGVPSGPSASGLGRKRSRHSRTGSKGGGGAPPLPSFSSFGHEEYSLDDQEQDPAELDIVNKGPAPGDNGPLIHIFIDHSNILIGLLNFLKRSPPPQSVVSDYLSSQSVKSSGTTGDGTAAGTSPSKPISIPGSSPTSKASKKKAIAIPVIESPPENGVETEYPIPLPSFATAKSRVVTSTANMNVTWGDDLNLSKSLPTESALDTHMARRRRNGHNPNARSIQEVMSDGNEEEREGKGGSSEPATTTVNEGEKKVKRFPRHLWHAAFVLVLERGRAISRRVVVTSSPLYQPMEKIQNLGYEVRVYIRVPDLGDGMDRERKVTTRPMYGGKGTPSKKSHMRRISGSTSAESGSAGSGQHHYHGPQQGTNPGNATGTGITMASNANTGASNTAANKIKYREQGVDELLQLKLHQAIADADVVPKGSTIVLATGDGNVGQFNEDGFLGPVRTALKRGWKVELYAWEDGLSRSWRREFGENSEWGKKGLFRIVPLEQFATSLVEASGW